MAAGDKIFYADSASIIAGSTQKAMVRLVQQTTGNQTALVSGADTVLLFGAGSEDIDTNNYHDVTTNTSRVTPTVAGYYRCEVKGVYAFSGTITSCNTSVRKNGGTWDRTGNAKPGTTGVNCGTPPLSVPIFLNGSGDYVEAVLQFVGTANQATNNVAGSTCTFQVTFERYQ